MNVSGSTTQLGYHPPYDWPAMLAHLAGRAIPGVEQVENQTWSRAALAGDTPGIVSITHDEAGQSLGVHVHAEKQIAIDDELHRVENLFDLSAEPNKICGHLGKDKLLAPMIKAHPGLRVPGCWTPFELVVRAIIGQQISVAGARTMLGRLAEAWGPRLPRTLATGDIRYLFPRPADLVGQDLRTIGLTRARADTLAAIAARFTDEPEFIHNTMEPGQARTRLLAIKGIGPWTADYVILRALRDPDAFPAGDLVLLKRTGLTKPKDLEARAKAWTPWRGYAAQHLWTAAP